MTQNEKDLLLKDLCARLPYGVKFKYEDRPNVCEILSITPVYNNGNVVYFDKYVNEPKKCSIYDVKPYLFPFSRMTEEQKKELNDITNLDIEIAISHIKNDTPNYVTGLNRLNWLLKNHFDIYGLITIGLANDATGLNIY